MATRRDRPAPQPQPRPDSRTADDTLRGTVEIDGRTTVVRLVGSVRCATAPALREALDAVLAQQPHTVVLDLAEVTADDELGLWVLPAMAGDAGRQGIELLIAAPHRALRIRLHRLGGHHLEITHVLPDRRATQQVLELDPASAGAPRATPAPGAR